MRPSTRLLLPAVLLSACSGNKEDTGQDNQAPTAEITYPQPGGALLAEVENVLMGKVGDDHTPGDQLEVTWFAGIRKVCEASFAAADGTTSCAVNLSSREFDITLMVRDAEDLAATDNARVSILPLNPPSARIIEAWSSSDTDDQLAYFYEDIEVEIIGRATDEDDDPTELTVTWSSDLDGDLGEISGPPEPDGTVIARTFLSAGTHIVTMTVEDTTGKQSTDSFEIEVNTTNTPPSSCEILAPAPGSSTPPGELAVFQGTAGDPNVPPKVLDYRWESCPAALLTPDGLDCTVAMTLLSATDAAPDGWLDSPDSGRTRVSYSTLADPENPDVPFLPQGAHRIFYRVRDELGATCSNTLDHTIGSPPVVAIITPADGTIYNEGTTINMLGTVRDREGAEGTEIITITWSSSLDGVLFNGPLVDLVDGSTSVSRDDLTPGDHVITLEARDESGIESESSVRTRSIHINDLPDSPTIHLEPAVPLTVDDLAVVIDVDSVDLDSTESVTYQYAWSRLRGSSRTAYGTTSTVGVPNADTQRGDVWEVQVFPRDSYGLGDPAVASVTIANALPEISSATITPTTPYEVDAVLVCNPGTSSDLDGDTVSLRYAWTVNGLDAGVTTSTLSSTFWDRNDVVSCSITPFDGIATGTAAVSPNVTVANSAPTVSSLSISPSGPRAGQTVSCNFTFNDDDGDADQSDVVFTSGGRIIGSGVGSGASVTGGFYYPETILCQVTPNDGADTGAVRQVTMAVQNTVPVTTTPNITPDPAAEGDTLTCNRGTTTDADEPSGMATPSWTYSWTRNGSLISGVTSQTLASTQFDRDDTLFCTVTPNDGTGNGAPVSSPSITITNSVPVVGTVSLSPNPVYEADGSLSCDTTGVVDADGDAVTLQYQWTVNSSIVSGAASSTLSASQWDHFDVVVCTVTPTDGTLLGTPVSSTPLTVENTEPEVSAVQITPSDVYFGDTLLCDWAHTDDDGDADQSVVTWTINGAPLTGASTVSTTSHPGDTLAGGFDYDDDVRCSVLPFDGFDNGVVAFDELTVENTPPVLASVSMTPTSIFTNGTFTCLPATATDVDAISTITYAYRWQINGSYLGGATASTLTGSNFSRDQVVRCEVTPNDGVENGAAVFSNAVTVSNSLPIVTSANITPAVPQEGDTLTCNDVGKSDLDGDTVTLSYVWTVNGTTVGATGSTLAPAFYSRDNAIACSITPHDGTAAGATVSSAPVEVANTAPSVSAVDVAGPVTASIARFGDTVRCTWSYTDTDGDPDQSVVAWQINGVTTTSGVGTAVHTGDTLTGGFDYLDVVRCSVTPFDGTSSGTAVADTLTITNTVPSITSATTTPSSPDTTDLLTCSPAGYADVDSITTPTYTYRWFRNSTVVGGATSATFAASNTTKHEVYTCEITPSDGVGSGTARTSSAVTIANTLPTLTSATIGPSGLRANQNATCTAAGTTDDDGDTVSLTYSWTVNGTPVSGVTTTPLNKSNFVKGDDIVCTITPNDGEASGTPVASAMVTVDNTVPSVTGVSISPTTAQVADTLTCNYTFVDTDSPPDTDASTIIWKVNGSTVSGATGTTLGSSAGTVWNGGDTVSCEVTPNDGFDTGTMVSASRTITNTAPVLASVTLTHPTSTDSGNFTCTPGATTDADLDTSFTYSYAWTVNGSSIAPTTSTLGNSNYNKGDVVRCVVTPTDGTTAGAAVTSNAITVLNTLPTLTSASITPSTAYTDTAMTCSSTGLADIDPADVETVSYAWTNVTTGASLGTGASLLGTAAFSKGDVVRCTATPSDSEGSGTARTADRTISNSLPTASAVTITPASPTVGNTLTCSATLADADGDATTTTTYTWKRGATTLGTGTTLSSGFLGGETITCEVTPHDGTASGTMASNSVTIANSAPTVSAVSISASAATYNGTMTCSATASDPDGTTPTKEYRFLVDGSPVGAFSTTATLSNSGGTVFEKNEVVTCEARATDGVATSSAMTSATGITILNTLPSITSVAITPGAGAAFTDTALTCAASGLTDPDPSDAETVAYTWYNETTAASLGTGATLPGTATFSKGDVIRCTGTPSDVDGSGTAQITTRTIVNSLPVASAVSVTPASPTVTSTLTCNATISDADGDATTATTYAWKRGATSLGTGTTLSSGFAAGESIFCEVTPNDGAAGTMVASSAVVIQNSAPTVLTATLTPATIRVGTTVTCAGTASDPDGGSPTLAYRFLVGGSPINTFSGTATFTNGGTPDFEKGDSLTCEVRATDTAAATGTLISSATVVANTDPVISSVAISPTTPLAGEDDLVCVVTATDADAADTLIYTTTWEVDTVAHTTGLSTTTHTDDTVGAAETNGGELWTCEVEVSDGLATDTDTASEDIRYITGQEGEAATAQTTSVTKDTTVWVKRNFASAFTLEELFVTVDSLTYASVPGNADLRIGIYNVSSGCPDTRQAQTASVDILNAGTAGGSSLPVNGDLGGAVTGTTSLASGDYWIAMSFDSTGSGALLIESDGAASPATSSQFTTSDHTPPADGTGGVATACAGAAAGDDVSIFAVSY